MKKAYLAGPDVFRQDAQAHGDLLKAICQLKKVIGLFPLDNEIKSAPGDDVAKQICDANIQMIKECDFVLANVDRFRGPSLDVGTAFEIGYAVALGKPVYAYRRQKSDYKTAVDIFNIDAPPNHYPIIEQFGKFDNLMIACTIEGPYSNFVEALEAATRG